MSLSKILSFSVLALAHALPATDEPSKIIRRQAPAPSSFPLGDACQNEWKYLNFNSTDNTDKARLQTLHDVICSGEISELANAGILSARNELPPYRRYFLPKDEEDDTPAIISSVLTRVAGTDGEIGTIVGDFIIDNSDFASSSLDELDCDDGITLAYTVIRDKREKIHFCDDAYTRGSARDVDCDNLDNFPSTKMDSFSRVALHEMMHYSSVGRQSALEDQIVDAFNADGFPAYDPPRTHGLLDPKQDDQPGLPENNADSYAWMSLESFISRKCLPNAQGDDAAAFFTENPPPYNPESDGSDADDIDLAPVDEPEPGITAPAVIQDGGSSSDDSSSESDDGDVFDFV